MTFKAGLLLIMVLFMSDTTALSQTDASLIHRGEKALHKLEPQFVGTPVYLIDDDRLKMKLKDSLMSAIELIEKAHKENPAEVKALYLLGKAYSFGHDLNIPGAWQKSTHYLEKCLELDRNNVMALMYLGKNYMDAEKFEKALELYQKAYELDPNSEAQKFIAFTLMFQGKSEEAISAMQSYMRSHPQDEFAKKALIAFKDGRVSKEVVSGR